MAKPSEILRYLADKALGPKASPPSADKAARAAREGLKVSPQEHFANAQQAAAPTTGKGVQQHLAEARMHLAGRENQRRHPPESVASLGEQVNAADLTPKPPTLVREPSVAETAAAARAGIQTALAEYREGKSAVAVPEAETPQAFAAKTRATVEARAEARAEAEAAAKSAKSGAAVAAAGMSPVKVPGTVPDRSSVEVNPAGDPPGLRIDKGMGTDPAGAELKRGIEK